jgi:hypothetical protein
MKHFPPDYKHPRSGISCPPICCSFHSAAKAVIWEILWPFEKKTKNDRTGQSQTKLFTAQKVENKATSAITVVFKACMGTFICNYEIICATLENSTNFLLFLLSKKS